MYTNAFYLFTSLNQLSVYVCIQYSVTKLSIVNSFQLHLCIASSNTMGIILGISVTFIIFCTLAYQWVQKRLRFWSDRGFLQDNPSFPLGNLSGVGTKRTNTENLDYFYKKFKGKAPAIGLYNFLSPVILPIDTELVKNILVRDFNSFHDRGLFYNKVRNIKSHVK